MKKLSLALVISVLLPLVTNTAAACTACFGQSDSEMAQGMNWGIYTLLAFVALILGGVTAFFVTIGRRSASATQISETKEKE
jgi:hypothetical protein